MSITFACLRNTILALVVLVLVMAMGSGPASATAGELSPGRYVCHATGNASSPEDVRTWVATPASDSGQAIGHSGVDHQGGLDIIPPIPGVLPEGQNWTAYGEQVHALGCAVPVDPEVTFADSTCLSGGYVAPSASAPAYTGLVRSTTGTVAPGETYTVTYTAKQGYGIVGPSSFTHAFVASPAGQPDCDQPGSRVREVPRSASSCASPEGLTTWVDRYTTPYVWDAGRREWVLGEETGPVRSAEEFVAYGDAEYFAQCAPDRPAVEERRVPGSTSSCAMGGVSSWADVWRTGYAWDEDLRKWLPGDETGPVREGEVFRPYTDAVYFEACAPDRPAAEERRVAVSEPSCGLGGVTSWTDVLSTPYVWDARARRWVPGDETGPVRHGETFAGYTDEAYRAACGGDQPAPEVREVAVSEPSCDLAGVTSWTEVYTSHHEWKSADGTWVLGEETGPARVGGGFASFTDAEYFEECAPERPSGEQRRVAVSEPSCGLGGVTSWLDVFTTPYVWDTGRREWTPGDETGPVRTAAEFMAYTDAEYFDACAPDRPAAEERGIPGSSSRCATGVSSSWIDVWRTDHVWDAGRREWVPGEETGPVRTAERLVPYTDAAYFEACAPERPGAEQHREAVSEPSCGLGGVTSWLDVSTTPYVWDAGRREWMLGHESGRVRTAEEFVPYTEAEYFEACAPEQPDPVTRELTGSKESCRLKGTISWTDTYATSYVWQPVLGIWMPGEANGPVRTSEFLTHTAAEHDAACSQLIGEETDRDPAARAEVASQDRDGDGTPAAAVPTVVDAGGGTELGGRGPADDRGWLWLLALGGGLLTLGFHGTGRRTATR